MNVNDAVSDILALHGDVILHQQQVTYTPGDEANTDLLCPQGIQFRTHHQMLNIVAW